MNIPLEIQQDDTLSLSIGMQSVGGGWKYVTTEHFNAATTSTSPSTVGTIATNRNADTIAYYVRIRAESDNLSYNFYGSDNFCFYFDTDFISNQDYTFKRCYRHNTEQNYQSASYSGTNGYGVYVSSISSTGVITISQRYNSTFSLTVNDRFTVDVYYISLSDIF